MDIDNTGYSGSLTSVVRDTIEDGTTIETPFDIETFTKEVLGVSVKDLIDILSASNGKGTQSNALANSLYGCNVENSPAAYPVNNDNLGYIFITRPDLNLQDRSLVDVRELRWILSNNQKSLSRFIRNTLDPRTSKDTTASPCPLVDPRNAFIASMTNHIISATGFPDTVLGVRATKPGVYKEVHIQADDVALNFGEFSINTTFKNVRGSVMMQMIYTWILYASKAYLGEMHPHMQNIEENRIDYTSRIYRITLDSTKTYIRNIWACGWAIPVSINIGQTLTYDIEKPMTALNGTVDVEWRCVGSKLNDELMMEAFNNVTKDHNPLMLDKTRSSTMKKLTKRERNFLQNVAYPYINMDTRELEWWVTNEVYKQNEYRMKFVEEKLMAIEGDDGGIDYNNGQYV